MPTSTLSIKGQTTIPQAVRELLHLKAGDKLDYIITDDGQVLLRPATRDVRELHGLLHRAGMTPHTVDEMNESIRKRFGTR